MTLAPFFAALPVIQFHILAAMIGVVVGPFVLFRQRRDRWHKSLGYVWLLAMFAVAISGLFIQSDMALVGHFGPIHLFSVFTLWGIAEGLLYIKRRNVPKHRAAMQSLWFGAVGLAGLFTMMPGRVMNRIVFGSPSDAGWIVIALGGLMLAVGWRKWIARVA